MVHGVSSLMPISVQIWGSLIGAERPKTWGGSTRGGSSVSRYRLVGLRRELSGVWAGRGTSLGCQLSTAIECGTRAAVVTVLCYSERYCSTEVLPNVDVNINCRPTLCQSTALL